MLDETIVHILGGGIGGTLGAIATCPLELIKVRLQSSKGAQLSALASTSTASKPVSSLQHQLKKSPGSHVLWRPKICNPEMMLESNTKCGCLPIPPSQIQSAELSNFSRVFNSPELPSRTTTCRILMQSKIIRCLTDVVRSEGVGALFKGLLPTLVGVLPSRGIYFWAYHEGQTFFQQYLPHGHSTVFLFSAGFASITASSFTCPIWYIKTRLQLDSRPCSTPVTVGHVVRSTWNESGIRGFYRGISASYVGSIESALNFVIYENIKGVLLSWGRSHRSSLPTTNPPGDDEAKVSSNLRGTQGGSKLSNSSDMMFCMLASAFSKAIAITIAYPHEVVRTRMREDGKKYRTFVGTLRKVFSADGFRGLYGGLGTHYIRQVPNSCIMIGTYEGIVFLLQSWDLIKKS